MNPTESLWYRIAMTIGIMGGIFFLPLSLTVAVVFLIAAGALRVGYMAWTGEVYIRRTPLDLWLAGFALLSAVSIFQSAHATEGWYNYWHLMGLYVLSYLLVTQWTISRREKEKVAMAVLASAAVVCILGLLQYNAGIDVSAERWIDFEQFPELKTRVFSTLGNPNVLAAFLVMVVGLSAGWALDAPSGKMRSLLVLLSVLAVICILLTYSRGAWLALGIMALIMAAAWKHWSWRALAVSAVLVVLLGIVVHEAFMARLLSIRGMFNPADSSVALRWALWESTLAMIGEHPWSGLGWGSYRFVYPEYDFFVQNEAVIIYHGHNTLLSVAAEIGIPGMLCFAVAWGTGIVRALIALKNADRKQKGFFLGLALALLGMAAFSLTDHVLFNIQVASVFWILLALVAALPIRRTTQMKRVWVCKKFRGLAGFFGSRENSKLKN